ncbi:uncharacterized protein [Primulina huaijiensis]|uniref:uncharacterized protein n=1 Tax=Primulina huaijiensis TaxID=1492673 RepID=UPI003CC73C5C
MAMPLTKLTQKNSKFFWSEECKRSFQTLKEKLASTPVFVLPTEDNGFTIYSDASKEDLGCVLMQESKANKVVISLSQKSTSKVTLASLSAQSCLLETVKLNQDQDQVSAKVKEQVKEGKFQDLQIDDKGILWMKGRMCVPDTDNLRREVMTEAHKSKFSIHPGSTKMYRDLKKNFWWNGMRRDEAEFVSKCLVCQQVKTEYQRYGGLLQPLEIT